MGFYPTAIQMQMNDMTDRFRDKIAVIAGYKESFNLSGLFWDQKSTSKLNFIYKMSLYMLKIK